MRKNINTQAVILILIVIFTLNFTVGCDNGTEKNTTDKTEDITQDKDTSKIPVNESEMLEKWNEVIVENNINSVVMVNLSQEYLKSNTEITYYTTIYDSKSIESFFEIINSIPMNFERIAIEEFVGFHDYNGNNVFQIGVTVFINGDITTEGLTTATVKNNDFGFTVNRDGYILVHLPSDLDYTYRSVSPVSYELIKNFYNNVL